ncbi:MAG: precorrin-8X methylmutase, partial [Nitrospinota bacterium]
MKPQGKGKRKGERPLVYGLYESPLKGEEIEAMSFDSIDAEAGDHGFSADEWVVVKRMIHTTADFALMNDVKFSADGIDSAVAAFYNASPIYVDSNMIRSGISQKRLQSVNPAYSKESVRCHVADEDV